jgi:hypothetical protein
LSTISLRFERLPPLDVHLVHWPSCQAANLATGAAQADKKANGQDGHQAAADVQTLVK